ncbi:MAG: hypothetical protein ACOYB8_08570 [Eubacteriaceae bacterium]
MKKAASTLLIIIVLVITMSIPVFAAGSSDTTVILNPVVTSSNAQEGVVVTGDTIQVSIASSTRIVFEGDITIDGKTIPLSESGSNGNYVYSGSCQLTEIQNPDNLKVSFDQVKAYVNHYSTGTHKCNICHVEIADPGTTFRCLDPLKVSSLTMNNGRDDNYVVNGDTVSVAFKTNRDVTVSGEAIIGGQNVSFIQTGDCAYTASATINSDIYKNGDKIDADLSAVTLADQNENCIALGSVSSVYTYMAQLEYGNGITASFTSSNSGTHEGVTLCKDGDTVTISLHAIRKVTIDETQIAGASINMTSENGLDWSGSCTISGLPDNSDVDFRVVVRDSIPGNEPVQIYNTAMPPVRYFAPIQAQNLTFTSSNPNGAYAINGDTVTLSLNTEHPVTVTSVQIEDQDVEVSGDEQISAQKTIDGASTDQSMIGYNIVLSDDAGNIQASYSDAPVQYYAPITVSNVSFVSSNSKNPDTCLKSGDSVTLSAEANHTVTAEGILAGEDVSIQGTTLSVAQTVGEREDQQQITYEITASDVAGNTPVTLESHTLLFYAPLQASSNVTATWSKTPGYVKNGDTLTADVTANHTAELTSSDFNGRNAARSVTDRGTSSAYTIASSEKGMPEGEISFSYSLEDAAGNQTALTDKTDIIYDRTSPNVKLTPVLSLFSNKDLDLTASFSDANLDVNDAQIIVNGKDEIQDGILDGTTLTKTVTLSSEQEYSFYARASDLAGNGAVIDTGHVIIDKTDPLIETLNIDLDKTPVYKTGVKLSDFFSVTDLYLKDIQCTITSPLSLFPTRTIGFDEKINDEGLDKSSILGTDMSSNVSKKVNYSFYVDGTAPKPIVSVKNTLSEIRPLEQTTLNEGDVISIQLDSIWMGDEQKDKITQLEAVNENGTVENLLSTKADVSSTEVKVTPGMKSIVLSAEDAVGNKTGTFEYDLNVVKEAIQQTSDYSNSPMNVAGKGIGIAVTSSAVAIASLSGFWIFMKLKKYV